jgi:hypothetical protein
VTVLYVVLDRRGRHVKTTTDRVWARRLRAAFAGRIVTIVRAATPGELHTDLKVAA